MASKKFQETELVNAAGDTRIATSPAQFSQFTFDGFYVDNDAEVAEKAAAEKAAADAEAKAVADKADAPKPSARAGSTAVGEKTVGTNPS